MVVVVRFTHAERVTRGDTAALAGALTGGSGCVGSSVFLVLRTFAVTGRGLDAVFDGKVFENPFGGFLAFFAGGFAFGFLEGLREGVSEV